MLLPDACSYMLLLAPNPRVLITTSTTTIISVPSHLLWSRTFTSNWGNFVLWSCRHAVWAQCHFWLHAFMAFAPFNPPVSRIPVIAVFFFYKADSVGGKGGEHRLKESLCDASSTTVAPQSTRPSPLLLLPWFCTKYRGLVCVNVCSLPFSVLLSLSLGRLVKRLFWNFTKDPVLKKYVLNQEAVYFDHSAGWNWHPTETDIQ